jgi:signal transduction histidine kinase
MERRSLLVVDATVPLIVGAVIVIAGVLHGGTTARPIALVVGVTAAAVLVARRRAPGWTLVTCGALVQLLFFIDPEVGSIAVLAPAVALYSLALTRGRLEQTLAAIAAISAVIVVDVLHHGRVSIIQTVGHLALVAIPLLAAETLRARRSYVSLLLEQLALVERTREQEAERRVEQERLRIARDLHDIVAHSLTTINVQAATAVELLDRNPEHARGALETIEKASRDAIAELRASVGVLRDRDHPAAPRAPAPGVENVAELVRRARDSGLDIRLDVAGERPERLSDAVSLAAYRIVQESLTNARRHAAGAPIRVDLSFEPAELTVAIANSPGTTSTPSGAPGVGITGMKERAEAVGGSLYTASQPNGFRVDARLPYALTST